ncbi:MAG: DNA polymerase III subunit epsilon [Robiginitomaculum sp.]|nr:MAG: DNA polymerase III subunit epsilon [Robiginitomaculum sp.]
MINFKIVFAMQPLFKLYCHMPSKTDLEQYARILEQSDEYRILRKIHPRTLFQKNTEQADVRHGLVLDLETTGLNYAVDEVIEIALVPFTYGIGGVIFEVGQPYHSLQETRQAITPEITAITSITEEMTKGQSIDFTIVENFVKIADLVVAHNAAFDRPFAEKIADCFKGKPWACSMSQINWNKEGFEGSKLAYLVAGAGYFYDGHRAVNDCMATLELLATILPKSKERAFAALLRTARKDSIRIWAAGAPYEKKDALKARGYRWNSEGSSSNPKSWFIDLLADDYEIELKFLHEEIFGNNSTLPSSIISALDRFSIRA